MKQCITCSKPLRRDNTHGYCRAHRQFYIASYNKRYREQNRDKLIEYSAKYYNDNREEMKAINRIANKEYYKNNKPKKRQYERNKRKSSIEFKIKVNLRNRLYQAIKNDYKLGSAVKDLGCSIQDFKLYIESKWLPDMNWDNWSIHGWHIDHIIPLNSFDLTNREKLLKAVHYTNLQPLWAKDNISKSYKI